MSDADSTPKKVSAPIRMSPELAEKVAEATRMTGLAQADILRLALAIGLEDLKKVNFDLPRLVSNAARPELSEDPSKSRSALTREKTSSLDFKVVQSSRVAEEPSQISPVYLIEHHGGIAAGAPITSQVLEDKIQVSREYPADHYALSVFGASMEPKVADGSTIIVRSFHPDKGTPKKGTIVVYSDGSGSTLKEFGYRKAEAGEDADKFGNVPVLRSLNKAFPDVQAMDGGRIDAVLVEVL